MENMFNFFDLQNLFIMSKSGFIRILYHPKIVVTILNLMPLKLHNI